MFGLSLHQTSIGTKLMLASLTASAGALLLACSIFMCYDDLSYRKLMSKSLLAISEITSFNLASSILFNDPNSANKTLSGLATAYRPAILRPGFIIRQRQQCSPTGRARDSAFVGGVSGIVEQDR